MEQVIEKCINEEFSHTDGTLDFSCVKLEIAMMKGETYQNEFSVVTKEETQVYVYSSNRRLTCDIKYYKGTNQVLHYQFDGIGLEEGEVVKGQISFVSEIGEYYLPFVVTIEHAYVSSSVGNIKNLFHFANLAKSNWLEAIQVFYSAHFANIFSGNDKKYFNAYRGLCAERGNHRNMDEFLIEISKKQNIEYMVTETKIEIEDPKDITYETLHITKNGWGATYLSVCCNAAFLSTAKETLTDDDFLGNRCEVECFIDAKKIHEGNNFGSISFALPDKTITIPVTVIFSTSKKEVLKSVFEKRKIAELTEYYIDFRCKKMHTTTWLSKSMEIVEELIVKDDKNGVARLFQAQLLITKERFNEAKWILDHAETLLKNKSYGIEVYGYYRYLTTLYNREENYTDIVAQEMEELYQKNENNWKIAWLLLYLKEEYSKNTKKRWEVLERLYSSGCTSPVIYLEAVHLIQMNPELLTKLTGFDLQILCFAAQRGILEENILRQIEYLMSRVKEFSCKLLQLLISCYKVYGDTEMLHAICTLLMKGNKTEEEYFEWYQKGVAIQLRITRLYEYYMLSIPGNYRELLPKAIMMYFAYNSNLPYEKKAFLYANILRNKEEFPEMERSYREQMEQFVKEQIKAEHINRDLAYLYQEIIRPEMLSLELAKALVSFLFYHEITVENPKIKQVIVIQEKVKGEVRYPLTGGRAFVSIYSTDYLILLQDLNGNRYTRTIPYMLEKMLLPRKFIKMLQSYIKEPLSFDVFVCESIGNYHTVLPENVDNFTRIIHSESIRNEYKKELRTKLVQYHYDHDEIREMDELLVQIPPQGIDCEERKELLKFMVSRGIYEKAFEWVKEFGIEIIYQKTAFRLASRLLAREMWQEDATLLELCEHAFKGAKYDENVLNYLSNYFHGMTRDLRDIWKAARDFETELYTLTERMLLQMLFSQAYIGERTEIFQYYYRNGIRTDLKRAFLVFCAYEYFVKERMMEVELFSVMRNRYESLEPLEKVEKLAILKYLSEKQNGWDEGEIQIIEALLTKLLGERIYFPFFMNFSNVAKGIRDFSDRTIIEYRTKPNAKVMLHYVCQREDTQAVPYQKQEMQEMYAGIFVKSFVLFFGERLQYYISEECDGIEQLTESDIIQISDVPRMDEENRFTLLNDIVLSKTLQDYETLDKLMEEYVSKNYMVTELFEFL